ncbi:MAG: molybdenum cofactor biosynthesis protein B [Desulfobacterales bacterium]
MGTKEHREKALQSVSIGIVTLSSTRSLADDESGNWMAAQSEKQGHRVIFHQVVPDHAETVRHTVLDTVQIHHPDVLLLSGGTGVSPKDLTVEAVKPLFHKELTAFGHLFAMLSYEEIGSAAILSRAAAGIVRNTAVFCMPGSLKACMLACEKLIFPELGHLLSHMRKG